MRDRAFASATELSDEIRDLHIGCVELLDFYLARAERHNPALNAIVVCHVDQARGRARAAEAALARGERRGPLHGIPMTVKESFNVAGLPTAAPSKKRRLTKLIGPLTKAMAPEKRPQVIMIRASQEPGTDFLEDQVARDLEKAVPAVEGALPSL